MLAARHDDKISKSCSNAQRRNIYIYIITVLVITKSLCEFVPNQEQYNMESAQYLGQSYYICSPMVQETVIPKVVSYQRLLKWYLIPP